MLHFIKLSLFNLPVTRTRPVISVRYVLMVTMVTLSVLRIVRCASVMVGEPRVTRSVTVLTGNVHVKLMS